MLGLRKGQPSTYELKSVDYGTQRCVRTSTYTPGLRPELLEISSALVAAVALMCKDSREVV